MNSKAALSNIYKDTILGVIIGWGGFTKLFPNVLESLADITDLGSYIALRIFSIFFFLLILIIVVTYWWGRGLEVYFKKVAGHKLYELKYKKTLGAIFLLLKLAPIAFFIDNQFFVYSLSFDVFGFPVEFNFIDWILWYYLVLAASQLWLVSMFIDKINGIKLLKANTLIFSLDLALGLGLVSFIEPWAFYKDGFILQTVLAGLIYTLFAFSLYLWIRNKNNSNIQQFKQFGVAMFVIVFLFSIFPAVNFEKYYGMMGLLFVFLLLVFAIIISVVTGKRKMRNYTSLIIGLSSFCITGVILLSIYAAILEKVNKKYFENRLEASTKISGSKVFPLVVYGDSLKNIDGIYQLPNDKKIDVDKLALCLADENHGWAYHRKVDDKDIKEFIFNGCDNIAIVHWDSLSKYNNVRKIYFNQYLPESGFKNVTANQNSINVFYNSVYNYIHESIIKKYVVPIMVNRNSIPEKLRDYLHPINYYTETLQHYKNQQIAAEKIVKLNNEIGGFEILQKHTQLKVGGLDKRIKDKSDKIDSLLVKISELRKSTYLELLSGKLHQSDSIIIDTNNLEVKKYSAKKLDHFFELVANYKEKQYIERYRKAQIIFHVYLKDSQRVGTYILIFTLIIAGFLYWFYATDELNKSDVVENESEEPFDTPNRFINILILSVIVILMYIARPIKPENIDPENPQWMMNLEQWYNTSVFDVSFEDHEDNASHSSSSGNKELLMVLKSIESKLNENEVLDSANTNETNATEIHEH
jgi:drug/metabolite transporter superfamily protein YnfA